MNLQEEKIDSGRRRKHLRGLTVIGCVLAAVLILFAGLFFLIGALGIGPIPG